MMTQFTCIFTTHDLESLETLFRIGHVTAGVELSVLLLESIADESELNRHISTVSEASSLADRLQSKEASF